MQWLLAVLLLVGWVIWNNKPSSIVHCPCVDVFGTLPRCLEKFLNSKHFVCSGTIRTKTTLDIFQVYSNYFMASFYKTGGIHFPMEAKEIDAPVVGAFTLVYIFVYRDDTKVPQTFHAFPEHQGTWHTRFRQRARLRALSISFRISSGPAVFPDFSVLIARRTVTSAMAFSCPKRILFVSGPMIVQFLYF